MSDDERKRRKADYMRRYYAENAEYREATKARAKARQARRLAEEPEAVREEGRLRQARWRASNPEHANALKKRHNQALRKRAQEYVNAIKVATPCADCGGYFEAVCMDFDHPPGTKEANVASLVGGGRSIKRIAREIAKCEVVCANCHRVRTRDRLREEGFDIEEAMP